MNLNELMLLIMALYIAIIIVFDKPVNYLEGRLVDVLQRRRCKRGHNGRRC